MGWGHPDHTVPEVARVRRPGGVLVFCVTAPLFDLCWGHRAGGPTERLQKNYAAFRVTEEADRAASFLLSRADWVRRFRDHGLAVERLVEPRPGPGEASEASEFWPQATEWVRRWPPVLIWKVRREARG